jgi:hypothetical protein
MPCPDLQPETGASRDTAGPDYSRQNSSTSALIRRIRADPCSVPPSAASTRRDIGTAPATQKSAVQHPVTHKAQVPSSRLLVLSSRLLVLSSRFSVLSPQFPVLSSQFSVLSSQFPVLSSQSPGRRRHRLCGTISALCCAFIHKLNGGLQSVRSSHSWH